VAKVIPIRPAAITSRDRKAIPEGLWLKCPSCKETTFARELNRHAKVCPHCRYHYPLTAMERVAQLGDDGSAACRHEMPGWVCGTITLDRIACVIVVADHERPELAPSPSELDALGDIYAAAVEESLPVLVCWSEAPEAVGETDLDQRARARALREARRHSEAGLASVLLVTESDGGEAIPQHLPRTDVTVVESSRPETVLDDVRYADLAASRFDVAPLVRRLLAFARD